MTRTPREAIAKTLTDGLGFDVWEHDGSATIYEGDPEDAADAVIAHIWNRAMSDEVIDSIANAMYLPGPDKETAYGLIKQSGFDGSIEGRLDDDDAAEWFVRTILTAIIGPRPEATDDRT